MKFTFPSTIFFIIELKFSRFENVSLDKFSIIEFGNIFFISSLIFSIPGPHYTKSYELQFSHLSDNGFL